MKKISLALIVMLGFVITSCKDNAAAKIENSNVEQAKERDAKISLGAPTIEFDKTEFDFGTITEEDSVEGTFKITNTGKTDLVITKARASCGCTVPEWPKDPIEPGKSAELKFVFNPRGKSGMQNKSITLSTNTQAGTEVLRVKGNIVKNK